MWTPAARAQLARDAVPYATSLTDKEWAVVAPFMPAPAKVGRPRRWPMRLVFDGVLHVLRTGCAWAHLPHEFPPHGTVHRWFLRLSRSSAFETMMRVLTALDRARAGRDPLPTAAVMDSRTLRSTPESGARAAWDGHKRMRRSKTHMAVDTMGHLLALHVTPANKGDRAAVAALADAVQDATNESVTLAYVDSGYTGTPAAAAA